MSKFLNLSKPYVIAEVGINHNGSEELAELMCKLSTRAGASAVKFQLFNVDELVSKTADMAQYQIENSKKIETQYEMLSRNVISLNTLKRCRAICSDENVDFICTAFDELSLKQVIQLKPDLIKWPSGEIDNLPLLGIACDADIPLVISTGMADEIEIRDAITKCCQVGKPLSEIILLHCTSQYPTPTEAANINSVRFLKEKFKTLVGFSDHTMGSKAAQLALAAGAVVFEKHVSLSRLMEGVDHRASATFDEFTAYIEDLHYAAKVLGSVEKKCFSIEAQTKAVARKSLVSTHNISLGDEFSHANVTSKRPGTGISPQYTEKVLGRKATRSISAGEILYWTDIG